jgi:hypothetical protein
MSHYPRAYWLDDNKCEITASEQWDP